MVYYVMEEMPDIHKTGERVLYPRFAMIDQVSTEQLAPQRVGKQRLQCG